MNSLAIALILGSATVHVAWNLSSKRQAPSPSIFLLASIVGCSVLSPVVIAHLPTVSSFSLNLWGLIAATGFLQASYYLSLASAYKSGDMSIAYPVGRAFPVVLVTAFMILIGKGDQLSGLYAFGAALVVAGCLLIPIRQLSEFRLQEYQNPCFLFALLAAFSTTGYSIVDDEALRQMHKATDLPTASIATVYLGLQAASTCVFLVLVVLFGSGERERFKEATSESKLRATRLGMGIYGAYGLVLGSMAISDNVSYVVAFRQISIPLGAIAGIVLLKEPMSHPRWIGVLVASMGLVLVAMG